MVSGRTSPAHSLASTAADSAPTTVENRCERLVSMAVSVVLERLVGCWVAAWTRSPYLRPSRSILATVSELWPESATCSSSRKVWNGRRRSGSVSWRDLAARNRSNRNRLKISLSLSPMPAGQARTILPVSMAWRMS